MARQKPAGDPPNIERPIREPKRRPHDPQVDPKRERKSDEKAIPNYMPIPEDDQYRPD